MKYLVYTVIACFIIAAHVSAKPVKDEKKLISNAKKFVNKIIRMEKEYDPKFGQLYADDADVIISRVYPGGSKKTKKFTGRQIKQYLDKHVMKDKRDRGERFIYSDFKYKAVGPYTVKVTMMRKQKGKKEAWPYRLTVGLNKKNVWKILKEVVVTEPI